MAEPKSNLALLMKLLGVRSADLSAATGADKAIVSRWTNGKMKLMPGHGWILRVADYLLFMDSRLKDSLIPKVLATYYPEEMLSDENRCRAMLLEWLATVGHTQVEPQGRGKGLVGLVTRQEEAFTFPMFVTVPAADPPAMKNTVVYGLQGLQGAVLQFVELVTAQPEPQELLFACPEGLDMLTKDKKFHPRFMDALMEMFAAGHTLCVVLRTDYRVSDIAEFSGRWLVAHLLGYIKSYYYDDFTSDSKDKMLAVVKDILAGRVNETERGHILTAIQFDKRTILRTYGEIQQYLAKSKQRFHYYLFEQPDGFLRGIQPLPDKENYLFARLPHFCVAEEEVLQKDFRLKDAEMDVLRTEFAPLLSPPGFYESTTPIRHIFCEDDIEQKLLKARHTSPALSAITGRRVCMQTQALVNRLVLLKKLLEEHKNYEICFLREEHFRRMTMQIGAWEDRAAIGWIPGGKSTACRDYTNVNALAGFCAYIWKQVPGVVRSRAIALRKLNSWLKKAEKYGFKV